MLDGAGRSLDSLLVGLRGRPKRLPCELLYDARGAALFERICTLDAYYLTRIERSLLERHLAGIAAIVGPAARVVEPGSGAGTKTLRLLEALDAPATYLPIDVCREQLERTAAGLSARFPGLDVRPKHADYTLPFELPTGDSRRTLVFFPGSTIGNFDPDDARRFLRRMAELAGPDALLLLGADATRDREVLLRAYDDEEGVTAAFNLNALAHLNRARDADFDVGGFSHRAVWNGEASRVEMHLVSRREQVARLGRERVTFAAGEPIVTEHCYKHAPEALSALLASAGWRPLRVYAGAPYPMMLWLCARG